MGATHTACPVIRGEKWSAPLWIHQARFQGSVESKKAGLPRRALAPNGKRPTADACVDLDKSCRSWASAGECVRNADFMIGSHGSVGQCRDACHACPYPRT
jgi:prolyl 4-hydroxylase